MVGIVDGSAENCRNVIIMVFFRLFFVVINQGFLNFGESFQQTKIQDKMLQNFHPVPPQNANIPQVSRISR
jgi:hypothetical protein